MVMVGKIFSFGNNYNYKPENVAMPMKRVQVRLGNETRTVKVPDPEALKGLNKVELRYNVRKGQQGYGAMKSLYNLRSVFGYRLGGAIRQAYVKLCEVTRHVANALNLHEASKQTRAQKLERMNNPNWDKPVEMQQRVMNERGEFETQTVTVMPELDTGLDKYTRMYSTRDVLIALRSTNPGKTDSLSHLKYHKWNQIDEKYHKMAEGNDYSFRKLVVDGVINLKNIREDAKGFAESSWNTVQEHLAEVNQKGEIQFNENKSLIMENKKEDVVRTEKYVAETNVQYAERRITELETKFEDRLIDHESYNSQISDWELVIRENKDTLEFLKDATYDQLAERFSAKYPEMKQIKDVAFVPKESSISKETFERAESSQRLDNAIGGLGRFVKGNTPFAVIKRGANYFKCAIGLGGRKYDNQDKQLRLDVMGQGKEGKKYDKLRGDNGRPEATPEGQKMWELLNNLNFSGKTGKDVPIPSDAILNPNRGDNE